MFCNLTLLIALLPALRGLRITAAGCMSPLVKSEQAWLQVSAKMETTIGSVPSQELPDFELVTDVCLMSMKM